MVYVAHDSVLRLCIAALWWLEEQELVFGVVALNSQLFKFLKGMQRKRQKFAVDMLLVLSCSFWYLWDPYFLFSVWKRTNLLCFSKNNIGYWYIEKDYTQSEQWILLSQGGEVSCEKILRQSFISKMTWIPGMSWLNLDIRQTYLK